MAGIITVIFFSLFTLLYVLVPFTTVTPPARTDKAFSTSTHSYTANDEDGDKKARLEDYITQNCNVRKLASKNKLYPNCATPPCDVGTLSYTENDGTTITTINISAIFGAGALRSGGTQFQIMEGSLSMLADCSASDFVK